MNKKVDPAISKDTFINLYTESLVIKYSDLSFEEMDSSLVKLYQKHNFTEEKYEKTEQYYKKNPKEWLEILAKVRERVKEYSNNEGKMDVEQ